HLGHGGQRIHSATVNQTRSGRAEEFMTRLMISLLVCAGLALMSVAAGSTDQNIIAGDSPIVHRLLSDPQLSKITFNVSGKVNTDSGAGAPGVTITFSRVSGTGALPPPTQTDKTGAWSQKGFEPGTVYRAGPGSLGFIFSPSVLDFKDARTDLNFRSLPVTFNVSGNVVTPSTGASSGQ